MSAHRASTPRVLHELHITGLGVIDDLDLALHPGLNVLTGETGAGKTMVTVGLALALGGSRRRRRSCATGATAARVQARFDAPDDADDWAEDGEVILARSVGGRRQEHGADRRSARHGVGAGRARRTGSSRSTVSTRPSGCCHRRPQTAFLDRFAGDEHLVALAHLPRGVRRPRARSRTSMAGLREAARDRERELDLLAYQVREIEAVAPQAGRDRACSRARKPGSRTSSGCSSTPPRRGPRSPATMAPPAMPSPRPRQRCRRPPRWIRQRRSSPPGPADWRPNWPSSPATSATTERRSPSTRRGCRRSASALAALKALQRKYGETDAGRHRLPGRGVRTADAAQRRRRASRRARRPRWNAVRHERASAGLGGHRRPLPRVGRPRLARRSAASWRSSACPGPASRSRWSAAAHRVPAGAERVELRFSAGPGQSRGPAGQDRLRRRAVANDAGLPQRAGRPRRRSPPWCSTRSTPASAARPDSPWGGGWRGSRRTGRSSSSRTCRRSRASPTGTSAWRKDDGRGHRRTCSTTPSASPSSHGCSPGWPRARAPCPTRRNCSRGGARQGRR